MYHVFYSYLFSLSKIVSFYPTLERPDLSSYLFPLLIKSVRVLNSFPIQFSMINRRSEPALSSIFIGLLSYSKLPLNPLKDRLKSKLVGSSGLEPPTSRLSGARSNHLSYAPMYGGDEEVRTPDPLRARQVLSQLSYTPISGTQMPLLPLF